MSKKPKTPFPINDDVDRALLHVHSAACKLVPIAAARRDTDYVIKAARALADPGSLAAVPVASVVEPIPSATRRRMMVSLLRDIPPIFVLDVSDVLLRLAVNDPFERVRAADSETFHFLRWHSNERFQRLGALEASQQEIRDEERAADAG